MQLHQYIVTPDKDLHRLTVQACFSGPPPRKLIAADHNAGRYLRNARTQQGKRLKVSRAIVTAALADDACIVYEVETNRIRQLSRKRRSMRVGRDRMFAPGSWLWRPDPMKADEDIEITFVRAGGHNISAPWQLLSRNNKEVRYRVGHTPTDWSAITAFGQFEVVELKIADARLRVVPLDGSPSINMNEVTTWLEDSAKTVAGLYGRFPLPQTQIVLVPLGASEEAVPFGQVMRGGGSAIRFFIDQTRPPAQYIADWTTVHELSHLTHPFLPEQDRWLAEGVASYYQNVLRARRGVISERAAWQKLYEGFRRGLEATDRRRTLVETAEQGGRRGAVMRIYWSGAAIALIADVQLREQTDGRQSLDSALGAFQACCLANERLLPAAEFLAKLDELTNTRIFSDLYEKHAHSKIFPDYTDTFKRLGLTLQGNRIELATQAPAKLHRNEIMGQRSE